MTVQIVSVRAGLNALHAHARPIHHDERNEAMLKGIKHGSRGDNGYPRIHMLTKRPCQTTREAIEAHVPAKFHAIPATPTHKAHKEATMNTTTITLHREYAPEPTLAHMQNLVTKPGDLTPTRQPARERLTAESMTVGALAKAIGFPIANVVKMLNNPDGLFPAHYVKDGRSSVPMIVAREVINTYGIDIVAELAPENPIKTPEQVVTDSHLSHMIGTACEHGSGCLTYECECGAHWIGHSLLKGCTMAEPMADWECILLDVPLGTIPTSHNGCPVQRAAQALIAA